jgi:hypothetical protein
MGQVLPCEEQTQARACEPQQLASTQNAIYQFGKVSVLWTWMIALVVFVKDVHTVLAEIYMAI